MEYLAGPNVITRQGQGVRVSEGDVTVEAEIDPKKLHKHCG